MDNVLEYVLKKITPSNRERRELGDVLKKIIDAADAVIKPLHLEKTIAGSFIRDTWLADKKEIDLFILFPVSFSRDSLEKHGLEIGKRIVKMIGGKHEIAYAEHPYVKGKLKGFSVDIVPCYKVESASKIKSAVDRTPFHNRYITENLDTKKSGDVRLLKQFCKSIDVYGSDIRTMGFSGYLCELLIIKYKSFKRFVLSAKNWEPGEFIDLEGHCTVKNPKSHFKDQPLVVIDPTDPKRNVAAALSEKNFVKFVKSCEMFVNKPSVKFFEKDVKVITKPQVEKLLEKRGTGLFAVKFRRPKVVDDILWSQMRKTSLRLFKLLKDHEFEIMGHPVWSNERFSFLLFEIKDFPLPETRRLVGPPAYSRKHSDEFTNKYKKGRIYVEGKRWMAEIKREYRKPEPLLKDFLEKSGKSLREEGVRSHIAKSVSKGFNIAKGEGVFRLVKKDREFARFLRKYFES